MAAHEQGRSEGAWGNSISMCMHAAACWPAPTTGRCCCAAAALTWLTISRHSRARPQPGTSTLGGSVPAGRLAKSRPSSRTMRPYDCSRSAAPSSDQSRAVFLSTYLQERMRGGGTSVTSDESVRKGAPGLSPQEACSWGRSPSRPASQHGGHPPAACPPASSAHRALSWSPGSTPPPPPTRASCSSAAAFAGARWGGQYPLSSSNMSSTADMNSWLR